MFAPCGGPVKGGQTRPVQVAIDDPSDPRLADYVDLPDPAARRRLERDELFVAEGVTAIGRLLTSGHRIRSVLVTPQALARFDGALDDLAAPVYVAPRSVLAATVGFDLHRGAVAAADRRALPSIVELATGDAATATLGVLEGLNDPENLGAVARSARAFGVGGLVLDPACIDPYYRRTVRVSMGEVLHLPVARATTWPGDLAVLRAAGFETWALTPAGDADDLWALPIPDRVAVLLGAEGPGLSTAALDAADRRVRIPIADGVDSLNVGHAAAVAFAHLTRRSPAPPRPGGRSHRRPPAGS
ncbi:MAG TPA: RNA methyltransferase [Ilumatobacteraceae bacterium]|nr:RNA methyltransferase [Ilumatobacteraceae bacterium]